MGLLRNNAEPIFERLFAKQKLERQAVFRGFCEKPAESVK
jgi:hypothetical protein